MKRVADKVCRIAANRCQLWPLATTSLRQGVAGILINNMGEFIGIGEPQHAQHNIKQTISNCLGHRRDDEG
jgi:hypothetical protein